MFIKNKNNKELMFKISFVLYGQNIIEEFLFKI
jgi:hypothetical protein